ncbi:MAG TPA: helix-turn-helix transcriptional regulator [Solirubrobacteraceae bacterium]|nr:helix-turn-helix transcriptional regulator [Solirubrobacteraceae bacterium]
MEGDLQRAVGRNLRAYREGQGLSQEAFADALDLHRTYMGGIERGERNLTLKSLERIAGRIGLDPLWLLSQKADPARLGQPPDDEPAR